MENLNKLTIPEISENHQEHIEKINIRSPLNYFVDTASGKPARVYRFFFMKKQQKYYAVQKLVKMKVEINGREGIMLTEKRQGLGKIFKMNDYYVEYKTSWKLVLETFQISNNIIRLNKSLNNRFPRILIKDTQFISNNRIFKLLGKFKLKIGKQYLDCIKISMEKFPGSGQKGILLFYLNVNGNLIYKANYHPKSVYPTVNENHFVIVNNEKYGLLHCSILVNLIE